MWNKNKKYMFDEKKYIEDMSNVCKELKLGNFIHCSNLLQDLRGRIVDEYTSECEGRIDEYTVFYEWCKEV